MFCTDRQPVLFWYSFYGHNGLSQTLYALNKPFLARSPVDVEGEVGRGVASQVLRLLGRHLTEFKDEIHKGGPERVEVELPSGCLLRDACRLQVSRQTPGRSAGYVKKGVDRHFSAAVAKL